MRIETNQKLVRRNRRFAQYLFFFSIAVLLGAFFVANAQTFSGQLPDPDSPQGLLAFVLPTLVLPIGVITSLVSVRMTNLWIRQPRPEVMLKEGLKGLSNKSVLYNYYHLPVRHVLICPQGVYAITTRFQDGSYTVENDNWITHGGLFSGFTRFFRRDGIGNPTREAVENAERIQKILAPIAPDVPVHPLIVFIDPRVRLRVENSSIPILHADSKRESSLKDFMRDVPQEQRRSLTPEQIEAFEAATLPQ